MQEAAAAASAKKWEKNKQKQKLCSWDHHLHISTDLCTKGPGNGESNTKITDKWVK